MPLNAAHQATNDAFTFTFKRWSRETTMIFPLRGGNDRLRGAPRLSKAEQEESTLPAFFNKEEPKMRDSTILREKKIFPNDENEAKIQEASFLSLSLSLFAVPFAAEC